jgi:NCS1 family nucleobase:cation symporter-1
MMLNIISPAPGIGEVDDNDVFGTFEKFQDPKDSEGKEELDHLEKFPAYIASLDHA